MSKVFNMRVRYEIAGAHVHMRIFTGMVPGDGRNYTLGLAGKLVMAEEEFKIFRDLMNYNTVQFLREGDELQ